jgi:hypothetical protein
MKHRQQIAIATAICVVPALLVMATNPARGNEPSDLGKNELLQRLDQLVQAIPNAGAFYTQGSSRHAPPALALSAAASRAPF